MTKKEIIKKLMNVGHSSERANQVYNEAISSNNPKFVLQYWGLKK